jgi:hypothetical protein
MEKTLTENELKKLREAHILEKDEIAFQSGDLFVAENVCTRKRRIIEVNKILGESGRKILKG